MRTSFFLDPICPCIITKPSDLGLVSFDQRCGSCTAKILQGRGIPWGRITQLKAAVSVAAVLERELAPTSRNG
jgi:hypothetical protein